MNETIAVKTSPLLMENRYCPHHGEKSPRMQIEIGLIQEGPESEFICVCMACPICGYTVGGEVELGDLEHWESHG